MEKSYSPEKFETRIYEWWEKSGWFSANEKSEKPAFTISMPPPNVTGALHNGHALFVTIQDALIRWKRMSGYETLWMPGTDHAGIATQMVVERELSKAGLKRREMGREKFLEKVWEWKEKHGNIITTQMRKLGASPDWKRERFTMDEGLSKAVREVFVRLYNEGLIYRGTRMINWSVGLQTAVSDLESIPTERKGNLWHIKYQVAGTNEFITIATTRPETMLGDTAVAVHPEDDRYKNWVGKKVIIPIINREIPVIADEYVEREFGTGALKVTPAHDFNDYALGNKHKLPMISVFNKDGTVNEKGDKFKGMKILDARKAVVAELEALGALVKVEDIKQTVAVCERSETVLEPMISDQWYVAVTKTPKSGGKSLGGAALDAVRLGQGLTLEEVDKREDAIKIVPDGWNNTYYHWMENLQDWCISRQLWWGHQIPAWYCKDCGHTNVWIEKKFCCDKCGGQMVEQDEDVLDTWFSSALWPFSTLGWPDKTLELQKFYPSSVMETGFDILFFWVARMIMMGMHFNDGKVPFKRVYLHAMVRDEKGQKMSKTKGNVIDPLDVIAQFGADAFRFTLSSMAGQGRDVKLSLDRVEGYKAFCNKLWNASRYALMRMGHAQIEGLPSFDKTDFTKLAPISERKDLHPINQYILQRLDETIAVVNAGFEDFRLNDSANEIYAFIWNEYCDWYIEFSKTLLDEPKYAEETKVCLLHVLESVLKLAHPLIPYVTEEIYQNLPERKGWKKGEPLMLAEYPKSKGSKENTAVANVKVWKSAIEAIRAFRGENGIVPKARPVVTFEADAAVKSVIESGAVYIKALGQLESLTIETGANKGSDATAEILASGVKFFIPMKGLVDFAAELARVEKEIAQTKTDIEFVSNKLAKPTFIEKAPKELVDKEKEKISLFEKKLAELNVSREKLQRLSK